jgi:hypothetical protein
VAPEGHHLIHHRDDIHTVSSLVLDRSVHARLHHSKGARENVAGSRAVGRYLCCRVRRCWAKSHVTWPEGTPHSQRPSTCASAPLSEVASRSYPWPERGRAPRPARWPRWGGSHRRYSPATRLAAPAPAPHVGRLARRWHTRPHDRRWNVVRSGLEQLGRRWSVVCESILSSLCAHPRLSQTRETRGDGWGATEHTAASPAPWIVWRARGCPDSPRHPIAVPSRRAA